MNLHEKRVAIVCAVLFGIFVSVLLFGEKRAPSRRHEITGASSVPRESKQEQSAAQEPEPGGRPKVATTPLRGRGR